MSLAEMLLALAAIVLYIVRIDKTIQVLEKIRNEPGECTGGIDGVDGDGGGEQV